MPELLAPYDEACTLAAADALDRCVLSHFRPAPEAAGPYRDDEVGAMPQAATASAGGSLAPVMKATASDIV